MIDARVVLGLTPSATQAEVKARYRKLAMLFHPDHNDSEVANEMMRIINLAYAAVLDPKAPPPKAAPPPQNPPPRPANRPRGPRRPTGARPWRNRYSRFAGDACDYAMPFGKHKGETLGDIMDKEPDYIGWLLDELDAESDILPLIVEMTRHWADRNPECGW